jgi:hypothetical protein
MTLTDALLEIASRWDEDLARTIDSETREALGRQLNDGISTATTRPLSEAVATLVGVLAADDPILDALERPRLRHRLGGHVEARPGAGILLFADSSASMLDPSRRFPQSYRPPHALANEARLDWNDETFLAGVLQRRIVEDDRIATVRSQARQATVQHLCDRAGENQAFVSITDPNDQLSPELPVPLQSLLAFDPVDIFLELPASFRTTANVTPLRMAAGLAPTFQLPETPNRTAVTTEIVNETNVLLDAKGDPWGVGSWWATPNAWLGAAPIDVLGSVRELEILQAARELTSGAW